MTNSPTLIESLHSNGGARSITRAVFPPGASAVLHYHTDYTETFRVIEGKLNVIINGKEHSTREGQLSPTIGITEIHTYKNTSAGNAVVDIILEPGHQGCESSNLIVAALAKENQMAAFSKKYSLFWICFYEITNTIPVGSAALVFSVLKLFYGRKKINDYKNFLLRKVGQ